MYCPHVGLAYCMLLHSSLWVIVYGRSVCDLVNACGGWREKTIVRTLWVIIVVY